MPYCIVLMSYLHKILGFKLLEFLENSWNFIISQLYQPCNQLSCGRIQDFGNGGPKSEGETRIEGTKRPRIEGEARTEGEAREKAARGLGRVLGEPLSRKFLKISTDNGSIWCIFGASFNHLNPKSQDEIFDHLRRYYRSLGLYMPDWK